MKRRGAMDEVGVYLALAVFFAVTNMGIGYWLCTRDFRKEAVKNGVAEWIANENGDAEFQWKTNSSAPSLKSSEEGK